MRTTLDIDNDVLQAAKEIAAARNTTAGAVVSELLRKALLTASEIENTAFRNGFPQFPSGGPVITNELVESLLDKDY